MMGYQLGYEGRCLHTDCPKDCMRQSNVFHNKKIPYKKESTMKWKMKGNGEKLAL